MRTAALWDILIFLLHGFVFTVIGLQLPSIIRNLGRYPFSQILGYGLLISLVTIVVRIIWVFIGAYWQKFFHKKRKGLAGEYINEEEDTTWKNVLVVAWTGTRGVISLAAALALPLALQDGSPFPKRHSIIFLAFVVIFVTLVVQGLSLPLLIRWLNIKPHQMDESEEKELQLYLATNTLHFIEEELSASLEKKHREELRKKYEDIINDLTAEIEHQKKLRKRTKKIKSTAPDPMLNAKLEITKFQRELLVMLHKEGEFSDDSLKKVEREMDLNELKLSMQIPKES